MIISLNWLKKFTNIDITVDELATLIGARLVEIEEVEAIGEKYKEVLVVKIAEASKLDGSDHLSIVKIDDGGVTKNIERDGNNLIQVVCGAPNVREGLLVAWLPPGSVVPETFGSDKPFILDTRKIMGQTSNGMIASPKELALFDEHDGILEIDLKVDPGTLFMKAYELDDYLLDIENKSLTHRPDCFGIIGFAREVSAIMGKSFKTPEWLMNLSPQLSIEKDNSIDFKVKIDDPELASRYQAVVMSNVNNKKKTPLMIQTYLSRVGVRPISPIVDVTNYLMMLTGQPLHAFDFDKLKTLSGGSVDIHVRAGKEGESLKLLDGKNIELSQNDIVIANGEKAIALAGAMGGIDTEVDENTQNILIESATFNLYNLRATQMRHGIFSEAITRFTKGQSSELTAPVLANSVRLLNGLTDAKCVTEIIEDYPGKNNPKQIDLLINSVNEILGSKFLSSDIEKILSNVEFLVDKSKSGILGITAPYWRSDIHIQEDIIEEVGRINGFDNIEPTLPLRDFTAVNESDFDKFRDSLRKIIVRAGANEILSYSFVHGDMLKKAGLNPENSYKIINSISPDLQYYRQTLIPSLLNLVHSNIKQGYDSFALFELNKTHKKSDGMTDENVPVECESISLVVADKKHRKGAPYYQVKKILDYIASSLGLVFEYNNLDESNAQPIALPFEHRRSAEVIDKNSGQSLGVIGDFKKIVSKNFKLPDYCAGFELDSMKLFEISKNACNKYSVISRYPSSERDICLKLEAQKSYASITNAIEAALKGIELQITFSPIDIYQQENSETKNITIRIKITSHDHTLSGDEVADVINRITSFVKIQTNAVVV